MSCHKNGVFFYVKETFCKYLLDNIFILPVTKMFYDGQTDMLVDQRRCVCKPIAYFSEFTLGVNFPCCFADLM